MLHQYLADLGLTEKEQTVYLVLAEIGVQPASIIAKRANLDRVTAYKNLKKLAERGFVTVYVRDGVQCFGIENFEELEGHLQQQEHHYRDLLERFPTAMNVLRSLKGSEDIIPKLQIFEGEAGIRSLFRDMFATVRAENLKLVRMLSANTFEEWLGDASLQDIGQGFFHDLRSAGVAIECFEVAGGLIPERIHKLRREELIGDRPIVARGTTNVFAIGHTVYLACYKGGQVGLKVKQAELAQIFHFIFDLLQKSSGTMPDPLQKQG